MWLWVEGRDIVGVLNAIVCSNVSLPISGIRNCTWAIVSETHRCGACRCSYPASVCRWSPLMCTSIASTGSMSLERASTTSWTEMTSMSMRSLSAVLRTLTGWSCLSTTESISELSKWRGAVQVQCVKLVESAPVCGVYKRGLSLVVKRSR